MKLTLELDGERFEVEVVRTADGVRAESEGETVEYKVRDAGSPIVLAAKDGSHVVDAVSDDQVLLDGRLRRVTVASFVPGLPAGAAGADARASVRAVMPGRIVKVLASAGQTVEKGQALFVLEAMKMQNEIVSPARGVLADVAAKPGDVVEVGRVLAHVAPR